MTSKTRPLTEREAVEEQLSLFVDPRIAATAARDLKNLRKRVFDLSDKIKGLEQRCSEYQAEEYRHHRMIGDEVTVLVASRLKPLREENKRLRRELNDILVTVKMDQANR